MRRLCRFWIPATLMLLFLCQHAMSFSTFGLRWRPYSLAVFHKKTQKSDTKKKTFWLQSAIDNLTSGKVSPGPRAIHHMLYWLTAADAIQSVIRNQYTDMIGALAVRPYDRNMVPSVYSRLFYFARLRPRLLYAVGALLRALQLCTPLGRILDPSIGVGAGINLCAIIASSRWVKPLILGWATTKYAWKWLGAQRVRRAYLPITLSIREWEEQKAKKLPKNVPDE